MLGPQCANDVTALPFQRDGQQVELRSHWKPNESVLLVFQPEKRGAAAAVEGRREAIISADPGPSRGSGRTAVTNGCPGSQAGRAAIVSKPVRGSGFPKGNPAVSGRRARVIFRNINCRLPADRPIKRALCRITCDTTLHYSSTAKKAGGSDRVKIPAAGHEDRCHQALGQAGPNQLAIQG